METKLITSEIEEKNDSSFFQLQYKTDHLSFNKPTTSNHLSIIF